LMSVVTSALLLNPAWNASTQKARNSGSSGKFVPETL
jgi:hypothetical protein